jgi:DNA mismatch repair ATPase MutS
VIVIEHVSSAPDPLREITHIYSPSTYIEDNNVDNNSFVSIYMNESKGSYYVGLSAFDISTGNSYVYHIQDINNDKKAIFEVRHYIIEKKNDFDESGR